MRQPDGPYSTPGTHAAAAGLSPDGSCSKIDRNAASSSSKSAGSNVVSPLSNR